MKILLIILTVIALAGLGACINSALYTSKVQKSYPASGQVVSVNMTGVHVLTAGDTGPVVLMIHGASANAREFDWSLAPHLSGSHRVLMVDRPGHGYSGRPDGAETLAVQAAQIAGALQAIAPGEKAVIVGHSFGGAVALRLALDYPELVDGLVLLAPATHDWGGGGESWYNKYAGHRLIGPALLQLIPILGPAQVKAGIGSVFSPQPAPEDYYEKAGIALLFRPSEFRANALDINALRAELAAQQSRYGELKLPVIVFSGAKDTVLTPQLHVGKLKHQVDGLVLVPLGDAGHMPHHSHPDEIVAAIARLAAD